MAENAIRSMISNNEICEVLNVADLGCGVGPTPVTLIKMVIEIVHKVCRELKLKDDQIPQIQMYMNDLISNDFKLLFRDIRELQLPKRDEMPLCFVMGSPGSFYSQLFPKNGLHLVHSNYALHWISQGIISREKADSFDMPLHYPCKEEMYSAIEEEGSFAIVDMETITENTADEIEDVKARADVIAKVMRAAVEVLVSHHFGEQIWNVLYDELNQLTLLHLEKEPVPLFGIVLMLKKNRLTTNVQ